MIQIFKSSGIIDLILKLLTWVQDCQIATQKVLQEIL